MWTSFQTWWAKPFDSQGSVWNWALIVFLVMVLILGWSRVIGLFEAVGEGE